jgi:membrane-associated phospholipid phosphatase
MKRNYKLLLSAVSRTMSLIPLDVVIVILFYRIYSITRNLTKGNEYVADNNARILTSIERYLHIYAEPQINHLINQGYTIPIIMSYFYVVGHFIFTIIVYTFVYTLFKNVYYKQRSLLLLSTSICLLVYYIFPLTPPRLLVWANYIDTVSIFNPFHSYTYHTPITTNQYAAMPSMHIVWSLWVSTTILELAIISKGITSILLRILAYIYPLITLFVIVATGNHLFLDAIGGYLVFYVSRKLIDTYYRPKLQGTKMKT